MAYFWDALVAAVQLILNADVTVYTIVWTSLQISLLATLIAAVIGVMTGLCVAVSEFPGKVFFQHVLNTLMAMPTVMIGLLLYGLLSRQGPFGEWDLLYTKTAVVLGEACLIIPIIMNFTLLAVQAADSRLLVTLRILGAERISHFIFPVLSELRFGVLAGVITGFGRAIGEVGAAMMLGGNIQGVTRTMTTAIALETSKGNFELGLALGLLLLIIAFIINLILQFLQRMT